MEKLFSNEFWETLLVSAREWIISELPSLLIIIIAMIIVFRLLSAVLNKFKKILIKRASKNERGDVTETEKRINTLMGIVSGVIKLVLWIILIMVLLQKFGVNVGPLLAGAGIIGVAVGFGSQELVRDFLSGFFMLLENQIREGDVAVLNGTGGLVEKIELRTTTLRDFSGVVHIFQNGKINTISNMTKDWSAMVFDIGVAYKENVDNVINVMKEVGDDLQNDPEFGSDFIEPIEIFGLDQFADSAVVIKARIKTKPIKQWEIGREYRRRLKKAFDEKNIEIPFPHTTIYWGEEINPLRMELKGESQLKK
jgi:moderate conductance mechanosensitive channel